MAEWSEDLHPRDHGKFSTSEGEHGVTDAHRARAAASLADPAFAEQHAGRLARAVHAAAASVPLAAHEHASLSDPKFFAAHADRISAAGDAVRQHYAQEIRAGDTVHDLAQGGIRGEIARIHAEQGDTTGSHAAREATGQQARVEEAARIHVENDAHGGDDEMSYAAGFAHSGIGHVQAGTPEEAHAAAMASIEGHKAEIAAEQSARDNENRAISAGHITSEARDVVDAYAAQHADHTKTADEHIGALHEAHSKALDALGALNSHTHEEIESPGGERIARGLELEHAHPEHLGDEFSQTHSNLSEGSAVHDEHIYYEHDRHDPVAAPEYPESELDSHPHPDEDEEWMEAAPHPDDEQLGDEYRPTTPEGRATMIAAHEAERAAMLAAHEESKAQHAEFKQKLEAHHAEFKRRAETAQSALEDLHAKQVTAHAALKEITAQSEKAHATATAKLDKMGEAHHVNEHAIDDTTRAAAHEASRTLGDHQAGRLNELGSHHFDEGLRSLHTEMKSTAAAIKELARFTRRAPVIAGKTKKGIKRRRQIYTSPDRGAAALAASY